MTGRSTDLFGRSIAGREVFKAATSSGAGRTRAVSEIKTRVEHGDMLEVIPRFVAEGVVCDAVVTDPPYHLTATVKRFGAADSAPAQQGKDGSYSRLSKGFMGQKWDGGDLAFRPETWATVATILRPGAFLVAFGGTRTYHRLVCAIEDAGFVIQDTIAWLYGSGFPKRRDMLKPALELTVLAYKPGGKRTMQADKCRIGVDGGTARSHQAGYADSGWRTGHEIVELNSGRWPANVVHDGSEEVAEAFAAFGEAAEKQPREIHRSGARQMDGWGLGKKTTGSSYGDGGSPGRFFYTAKPSSDERLGSAHPTQKPIALKRWLVRLVVPEGGSVIDPFAGTGTTGAAAIMEGVDSILIEREEAYIKDIYRKLNAVRGKRARTLY
jgi:site-specific DNA-methyltransferase (adenine-specific)